MTITVYKSTDTSAPVLSGSAGAMAGVLDACLVNGYGSQSAAGWAIAFTGTNQRAYRAASGNRFYLAIDDTSTSYCSAVSYETMTAVTTGTAPCPTVAQLATGVKLIKSTTADASSRPWTVIASPTFFYVFTYAGQGSIPNTTNTDGFLSYGDLIPFLSGDAYHTIIHGGAVSTLGTTSSQGAALASVSSFAASLGLYCQRPYTQTGSAIAHAITCALDSTNNTAAGYMGNDNIGTNFPSTIGGGAYFGECFSSENIAPNVERRGKIPGLYNPLHNSSNLNALVTNQDTIAGSGAFAGTTYIMLKAYSGAAQGWIAIQITGTWS